MLRLTDSESRSALSREKYQVSLGHQYLFNINNAEGMMIMTVDIVPINFVWELD